MGQPTQPRPRMFGCPVVSTPTKHPHLSSLPIPCSSLSHRIIQSLASDSTPLTRRSPIETFDTTTKTLSASRFLISW